MLIWTPLIDSTQLDEIHQKSMICPVLIFKHSTRCSISHTALDRFERNWQSDLSPSVQTFLLDLISYREISNQITDTYSVYHESPQVLLIHEGQVIYHESHFGIRFEAFRKEIEKLTIKS